jgi:hypothetical protein
MFDIAYRDVFDRAFGFPVFRAVGTNSLGIAGIPVSTHAGKQILYDMLSGACQTLPFLLRDECCF